MHSAVLETLKKNEPPRALYWHLVSTGSNLDSFIVTPPWRCSSLWRKIIAAANYELLHTLILYEFSELRQREEFLLHKSRPGPSKWLYKYHI